MNEIVQTAVGNSIWRDPERRALLERLYAEGLSYAEIGRRMGVSKNTISGRAWRMGLRRRPRPPGKILAELYLIPQRITVTNFAAACGVTRQHMDRIINGRATVTAQMAARLAAALGTAPEYWLDLQNAVNRYDAQQRAPGTRRRRQRAKTMPRGPWASGPPRLIAA